MISGSTFSGRLHQDKAKSRGQGSTIPWSTSGTKVIRHAQVVR